MSQRPQQRIVIVGGGTAGWMTAAALGHFLDDGFTVELVESDAIGTIGVGEATIPHINVFNKALGIDEKAFMRATQATYKLGIAFDGWLHPEHSYIHAFGDVGRDVGLCAFQHFWSRAKRLGFAKETGAYTLNTIAARAGRMHDGAPLTAQTVPAMPHAFHFDAGLYAAFLRDHAEARGVKRTEGMIADVRRHGLTGDVTVLRLADGREIAGDLFIDCSGQRGLLIGDALGGTYEDWRRWLPCDRAMAVQSPRLADLVPYTRAIAHPVGWQWRIPLQHRTGNGRVYCSDFITDDAVHDELVSSLEGGAITAPRPIRFTTGRRREAWKANVIAIGLSSGFLEPLESTSIHLIQTGIARLLKFLPGGPVAQVTRDAFNAQFAFEMQRIRDFIILHYWANRREEPFWQACRAVDLPDSLRAKIDLFAASGQIFREGEELFSEVGWFQVMAAQGIIPAASHAMAEAIPEADLRDYLELISALYTREVGQYPSHADYIARHCAAPMAQKVMA
ncbi:MULTISPECIES: tryptophan halogenase family protein [unclassified Novosphingobium]|uniref:tryptophan halogenase family protein n=1 Tax=unclassified Novosphingobium TaxID=2644732 RepID=UPI00086FA1EA|nr:MULTISPECIES: tryptophan halogenase family protein [unclassified Novosphingobium]MBN9145336.1 tryptophan 7-halogenase [Novosphingobium sp.]MDR6709716.1 tryptophan halogenase [Novosphingobium sp. 1748]ODU80287.1 MAG: tryptophan halogenase [Novosphingobium sp. SCN 63-17]OJX88775.1 MAG: tryptophan halogenase [Novosphingobium sp. 63-713]